MLYIEVPDMNDSMSTLTIDGRGMRRGLRTMRNMITGASGCMMQDGIRLFPWCGSFPTFRSFISAPAQASRMGSSDACLIWIPSEGTHSVTKPQSSSISRMQSSRDERKGEKCLKIF